MNRREALAALASSALLLDEALAQAAEQPRRTTSMGIVTYAFTLHQQDKWAGRYPDLSPAQALLEGSHQLGLAGIQVELGPKDAPCAEALRRKAEQYGMYLETSIMPPKSDGDLDRFEQDVRLAQTAGASVARTVILPGRRYEQFKSLQEFRESERRGLEALQRAEPVLARHRFRLAVENHKDQRIAEKLDTIKRVSSEFIGICVDLGNSFPLMEDPLEATRAFAPWAMTVHLKDQGVRENEDGFWLADVPLGEGFLDLPAMISALRAAQPKIHFNFETITRDPIPVPILRNDFWTTLPDTPARDLARTVRLLKTRSAPKPFVLVSKLPPAQQLALELKNIQQSIEYAREKLGLA